MVKKTYKRRGNAGELFPDFPVDAGGLDDKGQYVTPGLRRNSPPEQVRLPELADMKNLSMAELQGILTHYGVGTPWDSLKNDMAGYVARMTELTDKDAIQREVERLMDPTGPMARRHMLGMARRVDQTWSMLDAADGDMNAEFVWITEFDDDVCPGCEGNGGDEASLAEWYTVGLPGPNVCFGGSYCRCDLLRVDE